MKKLFTLLLTACLAVTASAQTVSYGFIHSQWPWNYTSSTQSTIMISGDVNIAYNQKWGEYRFSYKPIDVTKYKGVIINYSNYKLGSLSDEGKNGIQLKIESDDNPELAAYIDLPSQENGTVKYYFAANTGTVTTYSLQAKTADASITLNSVKLITDDGNEEDWRYGDVAWGCDTTGGKADFIPASLPCEITFTGQYGGPEIANEDGKIALWKVGDAPLTISIKFAEAIPNTLVVEANNNNEGFAWFNVPAGAKDFTFTLNDATCSQDVQAVYIKADQDADQDVYPYSVKFASIQSGTDPVAMLGM